MTLKINLSVSYLFFVIASVIAFEDVHLMPQIKGNILCRNCGCDVALSDTLISKPSSKSLSSFNDTLFEKEDVLVQVFAALFYYRVVSFKHSTCVPIGEWEESTTWFPGYNWKPCVCPDCGVYIGFVFEPINPSLVEPETFYGLILTTLIGEHCKYNLFYGFWDLFVVLNVFVKFHL